MPPAPVDRKDRPTFADRVARLEGDSTLLEQWPVTATIREMLVCIREQQAALKAITVGVDNYTIDLLKRNGMLITNGLAEAQMEAIATLSKWRIE